MAVLGGLGLLGCSGDGNWEASDENPPTVSWEDFKLAAEKNTRLVNGEKIYIVEWDMPIRESELHDYYTRHFIETEKSTVDVLVSGGADNIWSRTEKLALSYCVSTAFGANYARMQAEVARATWAWARETNVRFIYRASEDSNCVDSNTNVVVPVEPFLGDGACAFFPDDNGQVACTSAGRALVINVAEIDTWSTSVFYGRTFPNLTTEGVLRHELGHVLGLRHEHIRSAAAAINNCDVEYNNPGPYRALTPYEPGSVMHYPWCNGPTDFANVITPSDARGVRLLYGLPGWLDVVLGP